MLLEFSTIRDHRKRSKYENLSIRIEKRRRDICSLFIVLRVQQSTRDLYRFLVLF